MRVYLVDVDALGMAVVEALSSDSGEVLAVYVFGEEPLDVSRIARNMLFLEFVSGATDPGDSVLDVVIIRHALCGVHCSYICDNAWKCVWMLTDQAEDGSQPLQTGCEKEWTHNGRC